MDLPPGTLAFPASRQATLSGLAEALASGRVDLGPLVTHQYKLDDIVAAYDLFAHQRDGVLKIAIKPF